MQTLGYTPHWKMDFPAPWEAVTPALQQRPPPGLRALLLLHSLRLPY